MPCVFFSDDLNISPDFYEYFEATLPLLKEDSSLYCVSAWNDNGKADHIENDPGKFTDKCFLSL